MKKLTTKILDNYYTYKLAQLYKKVLLNYNIDYLIRYTFTGFEISVKHRKYDRKYYKCIIKINKENSIYHLCNLEELDKELRCRIEKYLKEN